MPTVLHINCPHCQNVGEMRVEGVHSGLGPTRDVCRKCGGEFSSGRAEWPDMNARQRFGYGVVSLLYVAVLGGCGAMAGLLLGRAWLEHDPFLKGPPTNGPRDAIIGGTIVAVVVAVLQIIRIPLSIARAAHPKPYRPSFWMNGGGQTLAIGLFWVIGLLIWLAAIPFAK